MHAAAGVLALLACAAMPAQAATLGHARLVSGLGAPLRIDIPVLALAAEEAGSLQVTPAQADQWRQAGLSPPVALESLRIRLEPGPIAGQAHLRVTSSEAFNQPIADLLLDLRSDTGQQRYQVSVLTGGGGASLQAPEARDLHPEAAGRAGKGDGFGSAAQPIIRVRKGDTMFAIARRHAVEGVSVYQMMIALQRANPQAFIQGNLNLVKAGARLRMPDRAALTAISDREARRLFHEQVVAFQRYRDSLRKGESVPETEILPAPPMDLPEPEPEPEPGPESAPQPEAPVVSNIPPEQVKKGGDFLRLSRGRPATAAAGSAQTVDATAGGTRFSSASVSELGNSVAENLAAGISRDAHAAEAAEAAAAPGPALTPTAVAQASATSPSESAPGPASMPAPAPMVAADAASTPQVAPTQAAPTQAAPTQAAPTQAAPTQAAPTQAGAPTETVPTPTPAPAAEPVAARPAAAAPAEDVSTEVASVTEVPPADAGTPATATPSAIPSATPAAETPSAPPVAAAPPVDALASESSAPPVDDGSAADDQLALEKAQRDARERISILEENVRNLNKALQSQGEAAKDIVLDSAKELRQSISDMANVVSEVTAGADEGGQAKDVETDAPLAAPVAPSGDAPASTDTPSATSAPPAPADTASSMPAPAPGAAPSADAATAPSSAPPATTAPAARPAPAAQTPATSAAAAEAPSRQGYLLPGLLGVIGVLLLVIIALLRRATRLRAAAPAAITPEMLKERMAEINLDLKDGQPGDRGSAR